MKLGQWIPPDFVRSRKNEQKKGCSSFSDSSSTFHKTLNVERWKSNKNENDPQLGFPHSHNISHTITENYRSVSFSSLACLSNRVKCRLIGCCVCFIPCSYLRAQYIAYINAKAIHLTFSSVNLTVFFFFLFAFLLMAICFRIYYHCLST